MFDFRDYVLGVDYLVEMFFVFMLNMVWFLRDIILFNLNNFWFFGFDEMEFNKFGIVYEVV